MSSLNPHPDPQQDRAIQLQLAEYAASPRPNAAGGVPSTGAELDRYDVAVVLQAVYEWGGYRYTNASDAIAAAKRAGQ